MPKQVYTWGNVEAGDIISFRYNNIGQNIINTLAAFVFISGLENIIIFYSVYIE